MVTDGLLKEFKERMNIFHDGEDSKLKNLLSYSIVYVKNTCGDFDTAKNNDLDKRAVELVLERTRYAYNDALEYFEPNFRSEIFALGVEMAGAQDVEERI